MGNIAESSIHQLPKIKAGTVAQVSSEDGEFRFLTPLVGVDRNQLIIAHLPSEKEFKCHQFDSDGALRWYESLFTFNRNLVLRLVDKGVVYAFETSVVEVAGSCSRWLVLTYPAKVYMRGLRKEPRFPCALTAHIKGEVQQYEGLVKDISVGGCQLRLSGVSELALNDVKQLKFAVTPVELGVLFPRHDTFQRVDTNVISVLQLQGDLRVGLAFASQLKAVKDYMEILHIK